MKGQGDLELTTAAGRKGREIWGEKRRRELTRKVMKWSNELAFSGLPES